VDEVAHRAGLPPSEVAQREERTPGLLERLARTLAVASPEMFLAGAGGAPPVERTEAEIVQVTERVIREAAVVGRVVLVGRGAQALLAQREDALHVYVVGSRPWRERTAVSELGVAPGDAARVVDEIDRQRDRYVEAYHQRSRQDVANYDIVLNAERLGFEGAAGLITADAKRRGWT
jgi:cytidylate kinase